MRALYIKKYYNIKMALKMNLLDKLDAIRVNSVTDKDYKEFWGESLDEHVNELMDFAREFDAQIKESIEVK